MKLPAKTLAEAKLVLDRERPELDPARPEDKRLYVERDAAVHDRLITKAMAAAANQQAFRWFFTGHTGTGKSTELNRIVRNDQLASRYIPHIYRVRDSLDVHNLDFTDIILGIAQSVAGLAANGDVAVPKKLQVRMQKWGQETELETQLGFSPEGKGGLEFNLLIGKATLEVQAGGEKRKIVREKLNESLTDFIKLIDDLVSAVEIKKKVLVVIDTLDHVDHRPIRDIFTNHWASLSRPKVSLLIVVPLPLLLEPQFMGSVQDNYSLLPNIKVFSTAAAQDLDPAGFNFFREVIGNLAEPALFKEDTLPEIFRNSGGMVRDMIGYAGDACKYADHDNPRGKVELKHVQQVLDDRKAFFRRLLTRPDYDILRGVLENPHPLGSEGLGPLLHLKAVIYYPNGEGWYGLNPAVAAIFETAKR